MHRYTFEQIEFLKSISSGKYNSEITKLFNKEFGLNVSENSIKGVRKRNKIRSYIDAKFKPEYEPWNKGKKGVCIGGKETQFKKGNIPHNYKPVSSERVTKSGYVEIKIADPNKWKGKHIIIFEQHHGKIPKGHAVIFADTNKRNFDIDNLILVSRQQLLIMNNRHLVKKDAELTKLGVSVAKLEQEIIQKRKEICKNGQRRKK